MYHFLLFSVHLATPSFFSSPSRRPPLPLPQTFSKTRRRRKRKWAKRVCLWLTLGNASEERVRTGGGRLSALPPPSCQKSQPRGSIWPQLCRGGIKFPKYSFRTFTLLPYFFVGNRIFIWHIFPLLNPLPSRPRGHGKHGGRVGGRPPLVVFL